MSDSDKVSLAPEAQDARYFASLAKGIFEIPCCTDCGRWHFFPRSLCPHCHSERLEWKTPSGLGKVYSTTTVRKPSGDYCVCLVDLDEGPRLMSTVVDVHPDEVHIGKRVRATVQARGEGPLLIFTSKGDAG